MTSVIPIVFATAGDPVGTGVVASLARPGGNITGLSSQATELAGKRIGLLREALRDSNRLAILGDIGYSCSVLEISQVQAAARKLGVDIAVLEIGRAEDIAPAFKALKSREQALYVCPDPLVTANRVRINTFAMGARFPRFSPFGTLSKGEVSCPMDRTSRISSDMPPTSSTNSPGTKPADLPVEQPTKFDLVINLITVKALGLAIPEPLLARADEVIE